jgi:prepilin-type N-terminal cleavage/methylation domain-containing protein
METEAYKPKRLLKTIHCSTALSCDAETMSQRRFTIFRTNSENGFTLVELSIVLVIVALLVGGMLIPLSAQRDIQNTNETQRQLASINEALLGFAAANGRLPCPASPATSGTENPASGGACINTWDGFVPAVTLGITPTNAQGYVIDSWGNPIRYAVTTANSNAFTTANGMSAAWVAATVLAPDLRVCNTATGLTGSGALAECAASTQLSTTAVAVIFSRGENGGVAPSSVDESANGDTDRLFVSHTPTPADGGNEFDDLVTWLSPNILYNRMITAGKLP